MSFSLQNLRKSKTLSIALIILLGLVEIIFFSTVVFTILRNSRSKMVEKPELITPSLVEDQPSPSPSVEISKEKSDSINPFCIATHLDDDELSEGELATQIEFLKKSGAGWIRFDFEVLRFKKADEVYDFSYFDTILQKLKSNDIGVIAILPQWGETERNYKRLIDSPEKYSLYVGKLAEYLKSTGMTFMIELGNEPNEEESWPEEGPEGYALYLNKAYDEIKKVDNNIKVISGGIVMWNPRSRNYESFGSETWLKGMYEAGVKSTDNYHPEENKLHFDFFAVHIYSGKDEPVRHLTEIKRLEEIIKGNGDDAKIAITEIGWSTGTDDDPENVSEEQQAIAVEDFYQNITTDPFFKDTVLVSCYYSLVDKDDGDEKEDNWGLLDEDLNPKPAFESFKETSLSKIQM